MRLKDLVHRSALRNRAAGDVEVDGGSAAQVFEVTNLLIPSGTDWSGSTFHSLGTFTLTPGQGFSFVQYLEADTTPVDDIYLWAWWSQSDPGIADHATTLCRLGPSAADPSALRGQVFGVAGDITDPGQVGVDPGPSTGNTTVTVGIQSSGATTADITVVRARAAFLLF